MIAYKLQQKYLIEPEKAYYSNHTEFGRKFAQAYGSSSAFAHH